MKLNDGLLFTVNEMREYLTESHESRAKRFCKSNDLDYDFIKNVMFPKAKLTNYKYLPALCEFVKWEDLTRYEVQTINKILVFLAKNKKGKEINNDLNPYFTTNQTEENGSIIYERTTKDGLKETFGDLMSRYSGYNEYENISGSDTYDIVPMYSFSGSEIQDDGWPNFTEYYRDYFPEDDNGYEYVWCITESDTYYEDYTKGGKKSFYFLLKKGVDLKELLDNIDKYDPDVTEEGNDKYPMDDYGSSMLAVLINPDGSIDGITSRWNHHLLDNEESEYVISDEELSNLLGCDYRNVLTPFEREGEDDYDEEDEYDEEEEYNWFSYDPENVEDTISDILDGNNEDYEDLDDYFHWSTEIGNTDYMIFELYNYGEGIEHYYLYNKKNNHIKDTYDYISKYNGEGFIYLGYKNYDAYNIIDIKQATNDNLFLFTIRDSVCHISRLGSSDYCAVHEDDDNYIIYDLKNKKNIFKNIWFKNVQISNINRCYLLTRDDEYKTLLYIDKDNMPHKFNIWFKYIHFLGFGNYALVKDNKYSHIVKFDIDNNDIIFVMKNTDIKSCISDVYHNIVVTNNDGLKSLLIYKHDNNYSDLTFLNGWFKEIELFYKVDSNDYAIVRDENDYYNIIHINLSNGEYVNTLEENKIIKVVIPVKIINNIILISNETDRNVYIYNARKKCITYEGRRFHLCEKFKNNINAFVDLDENEDSNIMKPGYYIYAMNIRDGDIVRFFTTEKEFKRESHLNEDVNKIINFMDRLKKV